LKLPNFAAAYQIISGKSLCSYHEVINELSIPVGFVEPSPSPEQSTIQRETGYAEKSSAAKLGVGMVQNFKGCQLV